MKIYLSGPMKGYPQNNSPLFNAVALLLRNGGNEVYNPAEYNVQPFNLRKAFAAFSKYICEEADAFVLLPGWQNSVGANAERGLAVNCGIAIFELHECLLFLTNQDPCKATTPVAPPKIEDCYIHITNLDNDLREIVRDAKQ